jgi:hypothetical protein
MKKYTKKEAIQLYLFYVEIYEGGTKHLTTKEIEDGANMLMQD